MLQPTRRSDVSKENNNNNNKNNYIYIDCCKEIMHLSYIVRGN